MRLCCIIIQMQQSRIMKYTKKREQIIEIFKTGGLLTANEVCERLPKIDRATIYRNLDLLSKNGVLRKINIKEGVLSYELNKEGDHHQHFICTNCEKVIPIDVDVNLVNKKKFKQFKMDTLEVNFKGTCDKCNH